MRNTKIVCTIGPVSDSPEILGPLIDAGMSVARLNFSHGDHAEHKQRIELIRKLTAEKQRPVAILQDLAGPKIRTGKILQGSISLKNGDTFTLTSEQNISEASRVSTGFNKFHEEVHANDQILLADGSIELRVKSVENKDVICEVIVGGELSSNKGINLPERSLSIAALTEKDKRDLVFGLEQDVDFVAMSFVRRPEDIELVKNVMAQEGKTVPIIAKIEKHEALANLESIIEVVDGVMVARGDLAVETSLEKVPLEQKRIIRLCNNAKKPVITATQMLKSMVDNPRPTRAEANDVANAVFDGTDAIMLSEETTIGEYPVEAVKTMSKIARTIEAHIKTTTKPHSLKKTSSITWAVSQAACEMAQSLGASAILTPSQSGATARSISSFRPNRPVLAFSPDEKVVRQLGLVWGVRAFHLLDYKNSEQRIEMAIIEARKVGLIKSGDIVVTTAGPVHGKPGSTNLIKVEEIGPAV